MPLISKRATVEVLTIVYLNKECLNLELKLIIKNQISFTLYPAHSRVGRGKLVLRHSIPHFLQNSTSRFASTPEQRNGNINLSKYLLEWGSNPQPVGFTVTLCAPAPRLDYIIFYIFLSIFNNGKQKNVCPQYLSHMIDSTQLHTFRAKIYINNISDIILKVTSM